MDDVRGDILGPPHGTTPAAVIANKNENSLLRSFKSNEHISEKRDGPYRGLTIKVSSGNIEPKGITEILQLSTR